jgi:hypothetical protein
MLARLEPAVIKGCTRCRFSPCLYILDWASSECQRKTLKLIRIYDSRYRLLVETPGASMNYFYSKLYYKKRVAVKNKLNL